MNFIVLINRSGNNTLTTTDLNYRVKQRRKTNCSFKNGEWNSKKVHGNRRNLKKETILQIVERLKKKYTITAILSTLGVARATYYRWVLVGSKASLSLEEEAFIELCQRTKYRNGHRKIKAFLKQKYQIGLNRNTVQSIMQKHNLQFRIKPKRKWKSQGESIIIAPDLLKRDFTAARPNQK